MAEQSNLALVSEIIVQEPSMEERSREDFLEKFRRNSQESRLSVFVFLAVFFQKGIDLTGNSLIGVADCGNWPAANL